MMIYNPNTPQVYFFMVQPLRIQPFDFYNLRDFSLPEDAQRVKPAFTSLTPTVIEEPAAPPPPPPPPTFSEAELHSAKEQAHMDGHAQGIIEGMEKARSLDAERDSIIAAQLRQISQQLESLRQEHQDLLHARRAEAVQLGITIAGMLAARALQQYPTTVAQELVDSCLPLLINEPKLTLTTHPAITEAMRQKVAEAIEEHQWQGTFTVEAGAALSYTECKLAWSQGEAVKSQEEVWQEILGRLLPEHIRAQMPSLHSFVQMIPDTTLDTVPSVAPIETPPAPEATPAPATSLVEPTATPLQQEHAARFAAMGAAHDTASDDIDEFAAYAPEYRIAREDENPIVQDILHTIEEVEQEEERKRNASRRAPPATNTEEL
jgi:flagellar assembly protein FliH